MAPAASSRPRKKPTKGNKAYEKYGLTIPEAGYGRDASRDPLGPKIGLQEGGRMAGVNPGKISSVALPPVQGPARDVQAAAGYVPLGARSDPGHPGMQDNPQLPSLFSGADAPQVPDGASARWPAAAGGQGAPQGPGGHPYFQPARAGTGPGSQAAVGPGGGGSDPSRAAGPLASLADAADLQAERAYSALPAGQRLGAPIAPPRPMQADARSWGDQGPVPPAAGPGAGGLTGWLMAKAARFRLAGGLLSPDRFGALPWSEPDLLNWLPPIFAGFGLLAAALILLSRRRESPREKLKSGLAAAASEPSKPRWSWSSSLRQNRRRGGMALALLALKRNKAASLTLALAILGLVAIRLPAGYQAQDLSREFARIADRALFAPLLGSGGSPGLPTPREAADSRRLRAAGWDAQAESALFSFAVEAPAGAAEGRENRRFSLSRGSAGTLDGLGAARTVNGILRPEESSKMGNAVSLSENELQAGLSRNAPARAARGLRLEAPDPSRGALAQGRAVNMGSGLLAAFHEVSSVPGVGSSEAQAGAGGRYQWRNSGIAELSPSYTLGQAIASDPIHPMIQLLQTRAYSLAAAPAPPGHCDSGQCAREFASNTSGVSFDGKRRPSGTILSASEFGDPVVAADPSQRPISTLADQAMQLAEDTRKCSDAETNFGKTEREEMYKLMLVSDDFYLSGCANILTAFINQVKCQIIRSRFKDKCDQVNGIALQKSAACPFSTKASLRNCNDMQNLGARDLIWQNWKSPI